MVAWLNEPIIHAGTPPLSYAIHLVANVPLFQLVSVCPAFAPEIAYLQFH